MKICVINLKLAFSLKEYSKISGIPIKELKNLEFEYLFVQ